MKKVLTWIIGSVIAALLIISTVIYLNIPAGPYKKLNNDLFESMLEYDSLVDDLKSKVNGQELYLINSMPNIVIDESSKIEKLSISLKTISNDRLDIVKNDKESKYNLYIEEMEYKQLTFESYLSCCKDIFIRYECDMQIYGSFELVNFVDPIKGKDVMVYNDHSFDLITERVEGNFLELDVLFKNDVKERIYLRY